MDSIKDRNGMNLTKQKIWTRGGKNTIEELREKKKKQKTKKGGAEF